MNKKTPIISVVIPAYNEEKFLFQCLRSLKRQTFKDFEIVVVDNNSSDHTAEIAEKYATKVLKEKRIGIVFARETGFGAARGTIIARTDADTVIPPRWLENIYNAFQKNPKVIGLTGTFSYPKNAYINIAVHAYTKIVFNWFARVFCGHIQMIGSNMAIKKKAWEKSHPHLNNFFHEDIDLSCHLAGKGKLLYMHNLYTVLSLRRIKENPIKGLFTYSIAYVIRYLCTIIFHHPLFIRHKQEKQFNGEPS